MQHSGVGGGGFMLVRGADGKYESIGRWCNFSNAIFTDRI